MVQVKVAEGILAGEEVESDWGKPFYSFKGVPYAEPPLGDLRFKAPQSLKPWEGVRAAKEHGPKCFQYDSMMNKKEGSEDCLYLNVYSPDIKPNEPLAVMVFIHGGAFLFGSGNDDLYGPEFLIRHNVILVTLNYRTEILGFLCLDSEDIPGNAGMKDQVAALRWVKKNIHNFGGDPDNITIFGESAGAASVSYHLISPMSKGLFKRAIAQSGASTNSWTTAFEPREVARSLARKLGLDSNDDKELYEFFKNQPLDNLVNGYAPISLADEAKAVNELQYTIANEKQFGNNERFFFGDVYDRLRDGIHEGVDVMAGYVDGEGFVNFMNPATKTDKFFNQYNSYPELFVPRDIALQCPVNLLHEVGRKMRKFYIGDKKITKDDVNKIADFFGVSMFVYGITQMQKLISIKNRSYLYKFTCTSERNWMGKLPMLLQYTKNKSIAIHADDLGYLFPSKSLSMMMNITPKRDSEEMKMIDNVTTLWTNFAKYGNPTPDPSLGVQWKPYSAVNQDYLHIGKSLTAATKPAEEEIQFWEGIYRQYLPNYVARKM